MNADDSIFVDISSIMPAVHKSCNIYRLLNSSLDSEQPSDSRLAFSSCSS